MFINRDQAVGYLAGVIDGEGHVAFYYHSGAQRSRHICISNTDIGIINACAAVCDLLEITYSVKDYSKYNKPGNKKPEYRLHIYGKVNCEYVLNNVPIMCSYKKEKLEEVVASFERSIERRQQGRRSFIDVKEVV